MLSTLVRRGGIIAVLALYACGSRAMVPVQSPASSGISLAGATVSHGGNPCQALSKQGLWYFHGSCLQEGVKAKATSFRLKPYKGITQTVRFPAYNGTVASGAKLVVGEGTNAKDITGTFQGSRFPLYGKVPCVNQYGSSAACAGKAVIYDMFVNATSNGLNWSGSPAITLASGKALKRATTCTLNQMISQGGFSYQITPVTGTIKNGRVTLPVNPMSFGVSARTIDVLVVSCQ